MHFFVGCLWQLKIDPVDFLNRLGENEYPFQQSQKKPPMATLFVMAANKVCGICRLDENENPFQ